VPSGAYTVTDFVPDGMSYRSAFNQANGYQLDCKTGVNGVPGPITCNSVASLLPGEIAMSRLILNVDDATLAPFRNWAEITMDSGDDIDSTPDSNGSHTDTGAGFGGFGLDTVFGHDDVHHAQDEDDSDYHDIGGCDVVPDPPEYDLAIVKTLAAGQAAAVNAGDTVDYEITITNQGAIESGEYVVVDTVPAGMSFVSASPAPVNTVPNPNGTFTWVFPQASELAPGAAQIITMTLQVDDTSMSAFRNWVEIESDSGDDDDSTPGSNNGSDSGSGDGGLGGDDADNHNDTTLDNPADDEDDSDYEDVAVPEYDLALIKEITTVTPTPAAAGTQVTYTVTVMNQGTIPSGSYTVSDSIPAGMSFVSATPAATTDPGVGSTGTVTWVVAAANELAPAAQTTFTLVVQIDDEAQSPYHNTAEITEDSGDDDDSDPTDGSGASDTIDDSDVTTDEDEGDEDDSDFADIAVGGSGAPYDLALIKTMTAMSPQPAAVGSQITYTITVMNQGSLPSGSYEVTDAIPAGMSFVSASPTATTGPGVGSTGSVTWLVPATSELASSATATFTLVVQIDDAAQSPYHNTSEITEDSGEDDDSDPTDGSGASDTFDDSDVTNDEDPGDEDDSDFADVAIGDLLAYDLALIKTLATGQSAVIAAGDTVNYEITIENQGSVPSGSYSVADMIPGGMSFVSAVPAPDGAPAAGSTGLLTWTFTAANELAATGDQQTITLALKVDDTTQAPFRNWAEIETDGGDDEDSQPGDNDGNDSGAGDGGDGSDDVDNHNDITIDEPKDDEDDSDYEDVDIERYDLALIKAIASFSATPATLGTDVTYTITVMNQSNVNSGTFTVTDIIPAGMTFVSASAAIANTVIVDPGVGSGGNVTFTVPAADEIAPTVQTTFTVVAKIADVTKAPFKNIADITADSGDDDTINDTDVTTDEDTDDEDDSDFEEFTVTETYDLALIKDITSYSASPPDVGTDVTYTITVMNQSNVPSGTFTVTDIIPAGMTFVSASAAIGTTTIVDPGAGNGGNVTYTVPAANQLAPNAQTTFTLVAKIADAGQSPFKNIADITEDSGDDEDSDPTDNSGSSDTINDTDVTTDEDTGDEDDSDFEEFTVEPTYDLALIKEIASYSVTPADVGTDVTYTITVMNQSNQSSGTFTVTDIIPAGMTFVSASAAIANTVIVDPGVGSGGNVTFTVPAADEIASMAQTTFTLVAKIADAGQSPFKNIADITADSGDDEDSDPTDNSGSSDTINDTDVTTDD